MDRVGDGHQQKIYDQPVFLDVWVLFFGSWCSCVYSRGNSIFWEGGSWVEPPTFFFFFPPHAFGVEHTHSAACSMLRCFRPRRVSTRSRPLGLESAESYGPLDDIQTQNLFRMIVVLLFCRPGIFSKISSLPLKSSFPTCVPPTSVFLLRIIPPPSYFLCWRPNYPQFRLFTRPRWIHQHTCYPVSNVYMISMLEG